MARWKAFAAEEMRKKSKPANLVQAEFSSPDNQFELEDMDDAGQMELERMDDASQFELEEKDSPSLPSPSAKRTREEVDGTPCLETLLRPIDDIGC